MCPATAANNAESHPVQTWGLCWRAAVGRQFFADTEQAERIRGRLIAAHHKPGRELVDFLVLPTEVHAMTRLRAGDTPGSVARAFGNVLSRWVREAQPVLSPVLAGPHLAWPIDSEEALHHEIRMLAWRPVVLKLCGIPWHHSHGALRIGLGLASAPGFSPRPLLRVFDESVPAARAALRRCVAPRPTDEEWLEWELDRGLELARSGPGPLPSAPHGVRGHAALLVAAGGSLSVDGALDLLACWVAVKLQPNGRLDLQADSTGPAGRARALVASLAVAHKVCSAAAVARHFNRAKATLCEQMAACRSRPVDRAIVATPVRRIIEEVALLRREGGLGGQGGRASRAGPESGGNGPGTGTGTGFGVCEVRGSWQAIYRLGKRHAR